MEAVELKRVTVGKLSRCQSRDLIALTYAIIQAQSITCSASCLFIKGCLDIRILDEQTQRNNSIEDGVEMAASQGSELVDILGQAIATIDYSV